MIRLPYNRARVVRWTAAGLGLAALVWYAQRHRPASAELHARERGVAEREARVRSARAATVLHGEAGLDSLLERFRADSVLLTTRIPSASDAPAVSAELKDALGHLERRAGIRVTATEPLAPGTEGLFRTGGLRVTVVGRYEDVGSLLAELSSLQRLTSIRGLRLHAIPDSLVRGARPYGAPGKDAPIGLADSAGVATGLADAGETPFKATAMFELVWYTLPAETNPVSPDSLSSPDAPSSFLSGGSR